MIVDKIEQYLREKDLHLTKDMEANIAKVLDATKLSFGAAMSKAFSRQLLPKSEEYSRQGKLYPSEATKCARLLLYNYAGLKGEPMDSRGVANFFYGQIIEAGILAMAALSRAAIIENNSKMEIEIAGKPWRGAGDGLYVPDDGRVRNVEIKKMSGFGFKRFKQYGLDDAFGYCGQLAVYMRELLKRKKIDEPGECLYLVVSGDNMEMHERVIYYKDIEKYAVKADENFMTVLKAYEDRKLPPRTVKKQAKYWRGQYKGDETICGELVSGNVLPLVCGYCRHKYTCWTRPVQEVKFDKDHNPIFEKAPAVTLQKKLVKNKQGGFKPEWRVVDV